MLALLKQLVLHVAGTLWAHLSCAPRSWEDLQKSSFKQCQDLLLSIPPLLAPDMQDQNIHSTEDRSWLGLLWSFPNIGERLLLPWTLSNLGYRRGKVRPMPALRHKWSNSKTPGPQSSQDTSERLKIHSTRPSTNYWNGRQGEQARGGEQVPSFGWKPHHKKWKDLDVAGRRTSSIRSECSASSKEVGQPGPQWTKGSLGGQACGRLVYKVSFLNSGYLWSRGKGDTPTVVSPPWEVPGVMGRNINGIDPATALLAPSEGLQVAQTCAYVLHINGWETTLFNVVFNLISALGCITKWGLTNWTVG